MAKIFFSYRRNDTAYITGRLCDRLAAHFGADQVFRDIETIPAGADFVEHIEQAVASCDALVAVIGADWLAVGHDGRRRIDDRSDFLRLEVATALERDVLVVPVLVENARMPAEIDLLAPLTKLARRNAIELSDTRWDHDVHRLIRALEAVVQPMVAAAPRAPEGIEVSLRAVGEDLSENVVHLFASEKTTVRDFLNRLYLAMLRLGVRFQAFTYNQDWVLVDPETGTAFSQMGTAWARAHGKHDDYRALIVAGIRPATRQRSPGPPRPYSVQTRPTSRVHWQGTATEPRAVDLRGQGFTVAAQPREVEVVRHAMQGFAEIRLVRCRFCSGQPPPNRHRLLARRQGFTVAADLGEGERQVDEGHRGVVRRPTATGQSPNGIRLRVQVRRHKCSRNCPVQSATPRA